MLSLVAALVVAQPAVTADGWLEDCGLEWRDQPSFVPVPKKSWEAPWRVDEPPIVRREVGLVPFLGGGAGRFTNVGALSGKSVYLSAGHGFTWTSISGSFFWRTQRPNTNDIVEDLVSTETLHQWLVPMLLNAGARVFTVRESDINPDLVLVDNGEAGYSETGAGFSTSTAMGWGRPMFPITGDANPFSLGSNRLMNVSATVTASATWSAQIPRDGFYEVSIAYTAFSARVTDAHFVVRHAGGETSFRVNQQRHGSTWVLLGSFYFKAGGVAEVVAQNDSTSTQSPANVSLDAVKFGGGLGLFDRGGGVSGRPRFEESARYQAQWAGAPASVYAPLGTGAASDRNNDISARPRFAAWVREDNEPAVYVAWHTNAANGAARGTQTYVYGTDGVGNCSLATEYAGVTGSRELADFIRTELVNDVRQDAGWNEPTWRDYGTLCANFGELNPSNNAEFPAVLLEVAFHDNAADAERLKEPRFRAIAARAIMQGIIRYFASVDARPPVFPPEPPTSLSARASAGQVEVRWRAPQPDAQNVSGALAERYRVFSSADGLGWNDGVEVSGTSWQTSLPAGQTRYFRVAAVNAGGEGLPSAVVGAREGAPSVLVVNGFSRFERAQAQLEAFPARYALDTVTRVFPRRINDGSTVRLQGEALSSLAVGFESATAEAIDDALVSPSSAAVVSWVAGRGAAGTGAPSSASQQALRAAVQGGTRVIFSGEASGSALVAELGSAAAGATGNRQVVGAGPLAGMQFALDDGAFELGDGVDVLTPMGSGVLLASYSGALAAASGVGGRSAMVGFPIESIVGRGTRAEVLRRLMMFATDGGLGDGGVFTEPDAGLPPMAGGAAGGSSAGGSSGGGTAGGEAGGSAAGGEVAAGGVAGGDSVIVQRKLAFRGGGCSASPPLVLLALVAVLLALKHR